MALMSTGMRIQSLTDLRTYLDHCAIYLFSSPTPANPDLGKPTGSSLIAIAAQNPDTWVADGTPANGITWEAVNASGELIVASGITVIAKSVASGTITYGWIIPDVTGADSTAASTTIQRIQVSVGVGSGEIRMANNTFTAAGQTSTLDVSGLKIRFPTLPTT